MFFRVAWAFQTLVIKSSYQIKESHSNSLTFSIFPLISCLRSRHKLALLSFEHFFPGDAAAKSVGGFLPNVVTWCGPLTMTGFEYMGVSDLKLIDMVQLVFRGFLHKEEKNYQRKGAQLEQQ